MLKKISFILCLLFIFSCKRQVYLPKAYDASLASLRFSNGLKTTEEFSPEKFSYTLEVPSKLKNFLIVCVPNNPSSTCTYEVLGHPLAFPLVPVVAFLDSFDVKIVVEAPYGEKSEYIINVVISKT